MGFFSKLFDRKKDIKKDTKMPVEENLQKIDKISREEEVHVYEQLTDGITGGNKEVIEEVRACVCHTRDYAEKFKERYEERGIDVSEESEETLRWLGMTDILTASGYAEEFDYKCEKEDFEGLFFRLKQFEELYPDLEKAVLKESEDILDWCADLDKKWSVDSVCIGQIEIDSDSYVVFPIKKIRLQLIKKEAEKIRKIIREDLTAAE